MLGKGSNIINKQFDFSIIIPFYNTGQYLIETIECVINQTIGFEGNVQLILVNDGSTDDSGILCMPYIRKYPNNIVYIEKPNGGVSSARNEGLNHVKGCYVNFLDSDDLLELNVLEKVLEYFEIHKDKIDLVTIPLYYFGAKNYGHILNNKFRGEDIVDLKITPQFLQLSSSSCFIKRDVAVSYNFDERMKYTEDAKYITEIVLEKMKYGVIKDVKYLYRSRIDGSSAVQNGPKMKTWYTDSLMYFSKALIEYSFKKFGEVIPYVQYMVMYDLQWRLQINKVADETLNEEERIDYLNKLKDVVKYIEDDVILSQKYISMALKHYVISLKDNYVLQFLKHEQDYYMFANEHLIGRLGNQRVFVDLFEIKDNRVNMDARINGVFPEAELDVDVIYNNEVILTEKIERVHNHVRFIGEVINKCYGFKCEFDLDPAQAQHQIRFKLKFRGSEMYISYNLGSKVNFGKTLPSYWATGDYIVHSVGNYINIVPRTFTLHVKKELGMIQRLLKRKNKHSYQAIPTRVLYYLAKLFKTKPLYLFMDRVNKAGDNAEALYEYSLEQKDGIKKYFIIHKESADYKRLAKKGKVLAYGSAKYKFYMLLADKVISSHADALVINPLGNGNLHYGDLLNFNFVFLQHGLTIHDQSEYLYKYFTNIKLFTTASQHELNSIVDGNYGYTEKQVKLLGFARYDKLKNQAQKKILIMPTWRKHLVNPMMSDGTRAYNDKFKESTYFKAFNNLINDKQLLATAKNYGYKLVFFLHPNIMGQVEDFDIPNVVEVASIESSYTEAFNISDLLVTDYSSVAYDFSYMKKPILYYQFESYYGQMGYYDYDTMGFGEVHKEHESLVNKMIHYMENNCEIEDLYKKRVDDFYAFTDQNNCKRIYNEINKL